MNKSSKKEPRKRLEALLLALKIVYFSTATIYNVLQLVRFFGLI